MGALVVILCIIIVIMSLSRNDKTHVVPYIRDNVPLLKYAKPGDAGLDLTAREITSQNKDQITYQTGISASIPEGHVGLVFPRSSIKNYDLSLSNSIGVIDSGYRGEIAVVFNVKKVKFPKVYEVGERVAQLVIVKLASISLEEVSKLNDTERGVNGYGSTGN